MDAAGEKSGLIDQWAVRASRGFRALQVANYRLFWLSQLISQTGSWMQATAQAWLVLQITASPLPLGVVTALQFLPMMLLSLFGGVLADRLPKHRVLLTTQTAALVQAVIFGTLVATGTIQLWHIYILAVFSGIINAIDNPVRQAFVVELVGPDHLVNAVSLNSMLFNGARIVGPALAGIVIAQAGIAPVLFLNAISFIAVLAGLLKLDPAAFFAVPARAHGPVKQRLQEGLSYSWHTPEVLTIMIVVASIGTFGYNFSVLLPLLGGFVLRTDAAQFGMLSAFLGAGSLMAALTTAYAGKATMPRLFAGAMGFSVLLAALALSTNFALSGALLVALGFAGIIFATSANTLLQLQVPGNLRGRVMSLYVLLFAGTTPIGGFFIGALSNRVGVSLTVLACAGLCLAGVTGALLYHRATCALPTLVDEDMAVAG